MTLLSRCAGLFAAPHAGWEALCPDIQELVLSNLSLRELACAARACRGFREAYLSKAADERANLIALANLCYGERFISNIVRAFRRSYGDSIHTPILPLTRVTLG
jgi:hypothetical protein